MRQKISISAELIACLAEINSDLGYILDDGINDDVRESLAFLHTRTSTLIDRVQQSLAGESA